MAAPVGATVLAKAQPAGESHGEVLQSKTLAFASARAERPLLIVLPLYRRPDLARDVVESLIACGADLRAIHAEVVLYNDSPQDLLLERVIQDLVDRACALFPCRVVTNPTNLGFVRTVNQGLKEAAARGMDALILNSDTVVFKGALPELVRVSRLDPMTGFVNPRSNNATLATLPAQDRFRHLAPAAAYEAWSDIQRHLPPVSYAPTAVGFCMLIRWIVLAEFGVFDEIYGVGNDEENDLVMRAGRRGYRAVLANRAFVWHEGGATLTLGSERDDRERANKAVLLARYPEYWDYVQQYFETPAVKAERLLGALAPGPDGRLAVALDFSHFLPAHNGTFVAGRQLLQVAAKLWSDRFNLHVIAAKDVYDFHALHEIGASRRDPADPGQFAAIFRVGQPYDYGTLERLANHAAVFGIYMLDTISQDCPNLADARTAHIWAFVAEHCDLVMATSELTAQQLERRLPFSPDVLRLRCLHSLDLADYRMQADAEPPVEPGYILVVGNHYWHKEVGRTVNALAEADPDRIVVAITGKHEARNGAVDAPIDEGLYAPRGLTDAENVIRKPAGEMTEGEVAALYANAAAVVFPSHYEGFGMPLLNALAVQRPVFVRPLPVFEEIDGALGGDPNVHVFATTQELVERLKRPPPWRPTGAARGLTGDAVRAAREIGEAIDLALSRVSYARIVRRIGALQLASDYALSKGPQPAPIDPQPQRIVVYEDAPPPTPQAFVARAAGRGIERVAAVLLRIPGVFALLRLVVHAARAVGLARTPTPEVGPVSPDGPAA